MTVYGIELGLSRARIAWSDSAAGDGPVRVGVPDDGTPVLAAAVAYRTINDRAVGEEALTCELPAEELRVRQVRRLLETAGKPGSALQAHGQSHQPEAVAEIVVRRLLAQSPLAPDAMVDEAVVGAPVDFDLMAQDALRRAVGQADLYVSRLVFEPVAVAAHYALLDGDTRYAVVCDLGGARLEVSALAISDIRVQIVHAACRELAGVAAPLELAAATVREVVAAATGVGMPRPQTVLLAGGGLRDPQAVEHLTRMLDIPVRAEEPDLAVVKGLVRLASVGMLAFENQWLDQRDGTAGPSSAFEFPEPEAAARPVTTPPVPPPRAAPSPPPLSRPAPARPSSAQPPPPPADLHIPAPDRPGDAPAGTRRLVAEHASAPPFVSAPPAAAARPVAMLRAERREDEVLVTFEWPPGAETAVVTWKARRAADGPVVSGRTTCSQRAYKHEGAVTLRVGLGEVEIEAAALVPGASGEVSAATVRVPALRPVVQYLSEVVGRRKPIGRITMTCREGCVLPCLQVVLAATNYRPVAQDDGAVVYEISRRPISPGQPEVVEFPLERVPKPSWLVCFVIDQSADVDVVPLSVSRLKVR